MLVNLKIEKELLTQLKIAAALKDTTMTALASKILTKALYDER